MEVENMFYGIAEFTQSPNGGSTWLVVDKYETRQDMRDALKVVRIRQGRDSQFLGIGWEFRSLGARFFDGVWHAAY
jgi:hypothetical protein